VGSFFIVPERVPFGAAPQAPYLLNTKKKAVSLLCNQRETITMVLENGIRIYDDLLKKCVKYVNGGWGMRYRIKDVVGIEMSTTFMFVHFNKEDYSKEAYPISINLVFKYE
jgi:hypothetical protein